MTPPASTDSQTIYVALPEAAVELPRHDVVDAPVLDVVLQPGPVAPPLQIGRRGVVDVLGHAPAARRGVLAHRLELQLDVLLLVTR